jgi:hypothetical protein
MYAAPWARTGLQRNWAEVASSGSVRFGATSLKTLA